MSDIKSFYISNKNSMLKNVIQSKVFIKNDHACISFKESINLFIANNQKYTNLIDNNFLELNKYLNKSKAMSLRE